MRISSVSRVWRPSTEDVDPIALFESRSLRSVQSGSSLQSRPFAQVLEQVQDEGYKRQIRVIEVLHAPGIPHPRRFFPR